jgi:ATP-dependent 26S proteasome regulatory subunit
MSDPERADAISKYTDSLLESRNWEVKLKNLRLEIKDLEKEFNNTEENIKALQSVGQIIGEVLKQLDDERCMPAHFRPPFRPTSILLTCPTVT